MTALWVSEGQNEGCTVQTANTGYDGTGTVGTNLGLAFTAAATGSYFDCLIAKALGTNVLSVLRVWVNNGSSNGTPANNWLVWETQLPATTAIQTAPLTPLIWVPPFHLLKPNYRIYAAVGTTVAAGWSVFVAGGKY